MDFQFVSFRSQSFASFKFEVFLSIIVQLVVAWIFGHEYDLTIFMAAGYNVFHGSSPYVHSQLQSVFGNRLFPPDVAGIGYPPLWALMLGGIYGLSYNILPNIFVYNLAIKIPIITGNILLAFIVHKTLLSQGVKNSEIHKIDLFFLFNPFLLYTTAVWGQIDSIVALFLTYSVFLLSLDKIKCSAIFFSLSIAFKPIPLVVGPLLLIFTYKQFGNKNAVTYIATAFFVFFLTAVIPFILFGWSIKPILDNWNFHLQMAGGFTVFNIIELFTDTNYLPASLSFLSYIWIGALCFVYIRISRATVKSFYDLARWCVILISVFYLTRTWVSEQNFNIIFPFLAITTATLKINQKNLERLWISLLIFTIFNTSPFQMIFLISPSTYPILVAFLTQHSQIRTIAIIARSCVTIPGLILTWLTVKKHLQKRYEFKSGKPKKEITN